MTLHSDVTVSLHNDVTVSLHSDVTVPLVTKERPMYLLKSHLLKSLLLDIRSLLPVATKQRPMDLLQSQLLKEKEKEKRNDLRT